MANITITYPLQDDKDTNFLFKRDQVTIQAVKSKLLLLLTTVKGTRFFNRGYGSNFLKLLFEQNDEITEFEVTTEVKTIVSTYIPNLTVNTVNFERDDNVNKLTVTINFTYKDDFLEINDSIVIDI
jgi:phage baseplate assembly protein W